MKKSLKTIILHITTIGLFFIGTSNVFSQNTTPSYNGLALTPPMGWNTWNTFFCNVSEDLIKSVADSMITNGMKDAGYEYVVIDDCWQIDRDENGVIVVDPIRFPSGIKALADYIHSKGLKLGIYSDAGTLTCQSKPGSFNFEEIDANTYASWGVDYVKFDWCFTGGEVAQTQYTKMSNALVATGRPIVFSICEWGLSSPWLWAQPVGNLWRATPDIQPCWNCTQTWGGQGWSLIIDKVAGLSRYSGPGHWNDPDMLEVGINGLNANENLAHFSMWCMLAAPLMAGNDIRNMSAYTKDILTNTELIAIDQDSLGIQGRRIKNDNGMEVWLKPLQDSTKAVTFFNRFSKDTLISITWKEIGLLEGSATVRDLWQHSDLGTFTDSIQMRVLPHGAVVLKIKGIIEPVIDTTLTVDKKNISLVNGNSEFVSVIINPSYLETDAKASNNSLVSIKQFGANQYRITGKAVGSCYVTFATTDGNLTDTCYVTITAAELPSPWKLSNVGENISSAFYDNGTFSLQAQGNDIGEYTDQCGYISQSTTGNKVLTCRIVSQTNPNKAAKSGIMFRDPESDGTGFVLLAVNPQNQLIFEWRLRSGAWAQTYVLGTVTTPIYLKLEKNNLTFNAYTSVDGETWTLASSKKFTSFVSNYNAGLFCVSHNSKAYVTAEFDNVSLTDLSNVSIPRLNQEKNIGVTIYPNPVNSNKIGIKLNKTNPENAYDVIIYTADGKLVYSNTINANNNSFEIDATSANLTNGVYHLVIKGGRFSGKTTFIVNKIN